MTTEQIRDLAIQRHEIDASYFQDVYSHEPGTARASVFIYGRNMILEELEAVLKDIPKGARVLDIGCGTGHLTNWIKSKGYTVFGLEASENMIQYAVKNFPDIPFKKGISSELPYENDYFDLIVAVEVLRYLDDAENLATYKEFHRVLKKGGKIFVTHVNLFASDGYYFFHKLKDLICKVRNTPHHYCNFTTPVKQKKILSGVNFKDIKTIGRMVGFIRIFYKSGRFIGKKVSKIIESISTQRYAKGILKTTAGHLIVIAKK